MQTQKRVAAIHDISCFGKCSLTVALPILSAAGIETPVIPTAVLSTHTGGFTGFTYRDLTDDIRPVANHWSELGLEFNAVYTGFLGSFEQIDIVSDCCDLIKKTSESKNISTLFIVDPVMADAGKLYSIFPDDFPKEMRKLCEKADIIVPNVTEAALLLDIPYNSGPHTEKEINSMLVSLSDLGPERVVITGVDYGNGRLGAASYNAVTSETAFASSEKIDPMYHGTGDVFASALLAALLHDASLAQSCETAVRFTVDAIKRTKEAGTDCRFGVNFEEGLPELLKLIEYASNGVELNK